jgi:predicted GNAT family acetyltransferase
MAPGDVHIYDKLSLPAYRGHGISNALRMHHLRYLQRAGYRRVIVAVLPENASSLRDILKGRLSTMRHHRQNQARAMATPLLKDVSGNSDGVDRES